MEDCNQLEENQFNHASCATSSEEVTRRAKGEQSDLSEVTASALKGHPARQACVRCTLREPLTRSVLRVWLGHQGLSGGNGRGRTGPDGMVHSTN